MSRSVVFWIPVLLSATACSGDGGTDAKHSDDAGHAGGAGFGDASPLGGSPAVGGMGIAGSAGAGGHAVNGAPSSGGQGALASGGSSGAGGSAGTASCDDVRSLRELTASGCQEDSDCVMLADGLCTGCPDVGYQGSAHIQEYLSALTEFRAHCYTTYAECPWLVGGVCPNKPTSGVTDPGMPRCHANADGSRSCVWAPTCAAMARAITSINLSECNPSDACVVVPDCLCGASTLADSKSAMTATFLEWLKEFRAANCEATYCGNAPTTCSTPQGTPTCLGTEGLGGPPTYQCRWQ